MIHKRVCWYGLTVLLSAGIFTGCGKSPTNPDPELQTSDVRLQTSGSPVLKWHWLGKKRLATEANATNFMAIWNLPESARLEAQTLDKLATAPWRLLKNVAPLSNAPTALLRPLLDDLVQEESYLEVRGNTNQPTELVLAVRLPADRAALWQTNLPIIFHSLSARGEGQGEVPPISALRPSSAFGLDFRRSGDWTLVAFARANTNTLLADFQKRLIAGPVPYAARATNYLIEAAGNLARVNDAFGLTWSLPNGASAFQFLVYGDGENLRTRAWLDFADPLNLPLDSWHVPSNLIHQPLVSFSAVRGIRPWLESLDFWKEKQLGTAPNQICFWSQKSAPWLHFFAVRSPDVNRHFIALKDYVLEVVNSELAENRTGEFAWLTNEAKVVWKGVPFCSPTFEVRGDLIIGGFVADSVTNRPMPIELIQLLQNGTNLVYYDWETTGPQVASWTQIAQLMRMAFSRAQLSVKASALPWLTTVGTNLGHSATTLTVEGNHRLVLARASGLGFASTELQLIADWLDSPNFPRGLHTLLAPRDLLRNRRPPGF